ncbi:MAG TPA: EAL domain-containing protein [Steroidobacteraceae bacterium]|nr:EAL domain-containing protein [Steroidobacteraceae bacterium]
MQPHNALPPRSLAGGQTAAAEPATAEALGWQLRSALPPIRLHSVSIYDSQGNVLWLSEGALGPDEHSLVLDALETLTAQTATSCCENRLEDGRVAAFLAVRAPQGHLVGLAMILADLKSGGEGLMDRIMSAPTRTVMQKLAVLLRPAGARKPDADPTGLVLSLAADAPLAAPAAAPEPQVLATPVAAPAAAKPRAGSKGDDELSPGAVNDILEFELTDTPILAPARHPADEARGSPAPAAATNGHSRTNGHVSPADSGISPAIRHSVPADTASVRAPVNPAVVDTASSRVLKPSQADTTGAKLLRQTPADTGSSRGLPGPGPAVTGAARALSLDPSLVTLEMLPFVKLRSGGRTRRFEVLPTGTARELRDPATLDSLAMQRLLAWLGAHRAAWTVEPASFTLNVSIATLEDDSFLRQVAAGLQSHGIAPDTVGFEIAEPLCTQRRAQVERFIAGCDKLGCFVIIDDFSFDSAVVPLLRSKALRLVKIDARLTGGALRDKLSQAIVVAVVQAVKVLGMHCAAQQVDSQAALQWLTAVGCDFAQGPMLARQQPLEQLLGTVS